MELETVLSGCLQIDTRAGHTMNEKFEYWTRQSLMQCRQFRFLVYTKHELKQSLTLLLISLRSLHCTSVIEL